MKRPGDVAIIHFAAPGQETARPHPVLLLREIIPSSDDWLVCMISTRTEPATDEQFDRIEPASTDYPISGLVGPSTIRFTRLAVVPGKSMTGKIGEISPDRLLRVRIRLGNWIKEQS